MEIAIKQEEMVNNPFTASQIKISTNFMTDKGVRTEDVIYACDKNIALILVEQFFSVFYCFFFATIFSQFGSKWVSFLRIRLLSHRLTHPILRIFFCFNFTRKVRVSMKEKGKKEKGKQKRKKIEEKIRSQIRPTNKQTGTKEETKILSWIRKKWFHEIEDHKEVYMFCEIFYIFAFTFFFLFFLLKIFFYCYMSSSFEFTLIIDLIHTIELRGCVCDENDFHLLFDKMGHLQLFFGFLFLIKFRIKSLKTVLFTWESR